MRYHTTFEILVTSPVNPVLLLIQHMGTGPSLQKRQQQRKYSDLEVGNYSLRHLIRRGSHFEIRAAVHKPTCTDVAVKVISKADMLDRHWRRLAVERDVLSHVSHNNIIKILETIETDTQVYLFMELLCCHVCFVSISSREKNSYNLLLDAGFSSPSSKTR